MEYDKSLHSKNKLGVAPTMLMAPMVPTGAQMNALGAVHLRLIGESYITTILRNCIPPSRVKEVLKAVKAQPDEPSYSGSDSVYKKLEVTDLDGTTAMLMAGKVLVCKIHIDPTLELISSDESIHEQIDNGGDPDEDMDTEGDNPDEND